MTGLLKTTLAAGVVLVLGCASAANAQTLWPDQEQGQGQVQGQARPQGPPNPQNPPQQGEFGPGGRLPQGGDQISPMDVEAMFEAMTIMEAERFVQLTPEQFPVFVQRLKKIQEARTTQIRRHNRALAELRMMANPQNGRADDATIDAKLKELEAIEVEARLARAKALETMDQLLSIKQRARFRLLEDNMEKKKIDFLTKVRQQGGRGGN